MCVSYQKTSLQRLHCTLRARGSCTLMTIGQSAPGHNCNWKWLCRTERVTVRLNYVKSVKMIRCIIIMSVMISLLLLMTLAKRFQLCSIFFNREVSFKGLLTQERKKEELGGLMTTWHCIVWIILNNRDSVSGKEWCYWIFTSNILNN